ncbi:MAG: hypothetical protein AB2417_01440 [Clostridiaceae bacterium]
MNKNLSTLIKEMENEVKDFFTNLQDKAVIIDYITGIQGQDYINKSSFDITESEIIFEDEDIERPAIIFNKDIIDSIEVDPLVGQAYISMGNVEVAIYAV